MVVFCYICNIVLEAFHLVSVESEYDSAEGKGRRVDAGAVAVAVARVESCSR